MALRLVERKARRTKASVSISGKYNRLLIFQKAYSLMKEKFGNEFEYVQFFVDDSRKGCFWLKPCAKTDTAATPINKTGNNRLCSISALIGELEWEKKETVSFGIEYDAKNRAWLVNTSAPLALPPGEES
ncbi:MAG: hypothetical protein WBG50_13825 [Desulfomonilaceae bacterium]